MKIFKQIKNNKGLVRHNVQSTSGGFTLIETMVAVLILSMALTALLGLISGSLFYARYSRNEITANYLLQEVIDSVKNERDSSIFLTQTEWGDFVNKYNQCEMNGCEIDVLSGEVNGCDSDGCRDLNYNENAENGSFYNYVNGTRSNFNRKVVVVSDDHELNVTVTVSWQNGNLSKSRSLSSSILNWQ